MNSDSRRWFKSSYSGGANTECVEVAATAGRLLVRDSKDATGVVLTFSVAAWTAFIADVRDGSLPPER